MIAEFIKIFWSEKEPTSPTNKTFLSYKQKYKLSL